MKLQLVGFLDGRPIGPARVFIRALVFWALYITGIGLLIMLIMMVRHPRKQGWHDLAVTSVMIKERILAPPVQPARAAVAAAQGPPAPGGDILQPQQSGGCRRAVRQGRDTALPAARCRLPGRGLRRREWRLPTPGLRTPPLCHLVDRPRDMQATPTRRPTRVHRTRRRSTGHRPARNLPVVNPLHPVSWRVGGRRGRRFPP